LINLVHAVVILMQSQGTHVENVVADKLGLSALLRAPGTATACITAMNLLRDLLRTGSVPLTGKCQGEPSRRGVTVLELQDYYIDIGAGEMSSPLGGTAADFPKITGLRVSAGDLARGLASLCDSHEPKTLSEKKRAATKQAIELIGRPKLEGLSQKEREASIIERVHKDHDGLFVGERFVRDIWNGRR
jgi:hypothetical protein